MPAYRYQCVQCQAQDTRIGGLDDHVAVCDRYGHLMLRLDHDLLAPYFDHLGKKVRSAGPKK